MLSTLFLVAGTALSCVYGIKENDPGDDFATPSFEETPCSVEKSNGDVYDAYALSHIADAEDISFSLEGIDESDSGTNDGQINASSFAKVVSTSTKLTKLASKEPHKDLYFFATKEKLRFDFEVTNSLNYKFQVRRYMRKTTRFICESRKSFSVELLPATYYLCVEDEGGSKINSFSYSVSFLTKRISNQVPFNGSRQSPFKMILWENEIWPFNGSRRGKETQTLQYYVKTRRGMTGNGVYNGYVDPVLMLDGKSSSEESENYLESVLYVLDSDLKKQISLYFQNIAKTVDEKLQSGLYNKLKFEAVKTGLELAVKIIGFTPVGEAVNLLYDIVKFASGQSELASLIQFIARTSYSSEVAKLEGRFISPIVTHAYGLATAANALSFTDDVCLEIPRYYKIKKNVIRKNKYSTLIHWDLSTSYLNNGNVNYEELFAHEGLEFSPEVKIKGLDNVYRGSLHLLYGEDALARLLDSEAKSPDEI